jgi:diacylglycerol kinase
MHTQDEPGMSLLSEPPFLELPETPLEAKRPRRTWRCKFRDAFRGIKFGVRGQSSFFVHFFFTALVIVAAIVLQCSMVEWCLLLGCIGLVLVAEMFNSAIETLFRGLDETARERVWPALDISAAAVLLASVTAVLVGAIIFINRFWAFFHLLPFFPSANG